jgi:hypothetical protein
MSTNPLNVIHFPCGQQGQPACPPQPADGVAYTLEEVMAHASAVYAQAKEEAKTSDPFVSLQALSAALAQLQADHRALEKRYVDDYTRVMNWEGEQDKRLKALDGIDNPIQAPQGELAE